MIYNSNYSLNWTVNQILIWNDMNMISNFIVYVKISIYILLIKRFMETENETKKYCCSELNSKSGIALWLCNNHVTVLVLSCHNIKIAT